MLEAEQWAEHLGSRWLTIRLPDLIAEPAATLKQVTKHLSIDMDKCWLEWACSQLGASSDAEREHHAATDDYNRIQIDYDFSGQIQFETVKESI